LNAFDFKDLQDKVLRPIANLQNITIHRTLSDRFLEAFQEQVEQNISYESTEVCLKIYYTVSLYKIITVIVDKICCF
jgi:hypothetical protein